MVAEIDVTFDRPAGGRAETLAPGLYPNSLFYPAKGQFHLFNTCNTWVARALRTSGLSVTPVGAITAAGVMQQVRDAARAR